MKTIAIPILAVVLSLNLSCQKEQDEMETKTINVTLAPGETYTNNLGQHDDLSITLQAEHASVSQLNSNNGDKIFAYTPSEGYVGGDQVQISSSQENQHGHGGGCPMHKQHDESMVYVYKITVTGETH
jgi:hypothetical protein